MDGRPASDGGSVCAEANAIELKGALAGCPASANCCFCKCMAQDKSGDYNSGTKACTCVAKDPPKACTGGELTSAKACVADPAKCESKYKGLAASFCGATPLP